jgi:hypothetical protein
MTEAAIPVSRRMLVDGGPRHLSVAFGGGEMTGWGGKRID